MSRFPHLFLGAALAMAGACTDNLDAPAGPDAGASAAPDDGQWARIRVDGQVRRVHYEVVDGKAIWDDDIGLGPVGRVTAFAGATIDMGERWTNGVVRFNIDPSVSSTNRARIAAVHAEYERLTPLRFTDVTSNPTGDYVTYYEIPGGGGAIAFGVGMQGGEQEIELHGEVGNSVIRHELGHAIGFFHEQKRPDASSWIVRRWECIDDDYETQFDDEPESLPLTPYDLGSYMHYATGSRCESPRPAGCTINFDANGDGTTEDYCDTMHRVSDGTPIFPSGAFTRWDLGAIWRMYGKPIGNEEAGDHFGQALAVGDFNDDGFMDVAVGAPGEDSGAGVVMIFRGSSTRLVPWKVLRASQAQGSNQAGAEFGASLAVGDVDFDGVDDLLVGAPGEDLSVPGVMYIDTGAAYLFHGDAGGPTGWRRYSQTWSGGSTEQTGDRFGTAVAIGGLAGSKATGWERAVLIGAPYESNLTRTGTVRNGAVFVYDQRLDPLEIINTRLTNKIATSLGGSPRFGATITAGNLDGDTMTDVAIGAPGANQVMIYAGRAPVAAEGATSDLTTYRQALAGPSGALGFGAAIAIGQARGASRNELLVGAPDTNSAAGAAYLYESTSASLAAGTVLLRQTFTEAAPAIVEAGDQFGAAVKIADVEASTDQADIIIGAPGENAGEGVVQVWRGTTGDATYARMLLDSGSAPGVNEAGDRFGAAIGAGDFDGPAAMWSSDQWGKDGFVFKDVVIGHPGEAPDHFVGAEGPAGAGAISVYVGSATALSGSLSYGEHSYAQE